MTSPTQQTPLYSRKEIGMQMAKGAGIATVVFFGPVVAIYIMYLVGTFLPEESRETPDPTPDSFSQVIDTQNARHV